MGCHTIPYGTAVRSQKMFAAIARAEPLLRKEADTPYGQSAAAKTPACRKEPAEGPRQRREGCLSKYHPLRGGISSGRRQGTEPTARRPRNLPSACRRQSRPSSPATAFATMAGWPEAARGRLGPSQCYSLLVGGRETPRSVSMPVRPYGLTGTALRAAFRSPPAREGPAFS